MPGPIVYAGITLIARDRLRQLRDALRAKEAGGRVVNDLERQVRYLADRAFEMLSAHHPSVESPARLYGPGLEDRVSKFSLLGALGPELPAYAALFAPGQAWLRDLLHKGTPDANREKVVAATSDFVLAFWRNVQPLVQQAFSDEAERRNALLAMQAYVLGHVCHVAADLVSSPYLDNLEFRFGDATRPALTRNAIVGALEVEVSNRLFQRGTRVRGNDWADWWPSPKQVPDAFYRAYRQAVEQSYPPAGATPGGAEFNRQHVKDAPPALSETLLKDGFTSFRTQFESGAAWDYVDWLGATWFMFLPSLAALPLSAALPNGRYKLSPADQKPGDYDDDKATYEIVALPFALNAVSALYYSIIGTTSYLGAESGVVFGWVSTGVQLAAGIAYFASLGASAGSLAARWPLLFGLPLALQAAHALFLLINGTRDPRRMQLAVSVLLPLGLSLLFIALWYGFLHGGVGDRKIDGGALAWRIVVWFLILLGLWFGIAALLRFVFAPRIGDPAANPIAGNQHHHVRLFDDNSLFMMPRATSPTLADLYFPSGRRPLLRLWWEGADAPTVLADHDHIDFAFGAAGTVTIRAPLAPTKLSEFAGFLERNVRHPASHATGLKARIVFDAADELALEDYELPPGAVFSDHGDTQTTQQAHDDEAKKAVALGGADADDAYVLYHAPKVYQSVRFEKSGPTLDQEQRTAAQAGRGVANNVAGSAIVTVGGPPADFTRLPLLFKPGDAIEAPLGGPRRIVVSVDSDTQLTVSTPFPGGLAGAAFGRAARVYAVAPGGLVENPPLAGWTVQPHQFQPSVLDGAGPVGPPAFSFGTMFRPGDTIRIQPAAGPAQDRRVIAVTSDTQLVVSRPLDPPLSARDRATPAIAAPATPFVRLVTEAENLFAYVAGTDDVLGDGGALMNDAADLAVLLALGATSQLLSPTERAKASVGTANDIEPVMQVFRNWNLDRRRVNEWKMLVAGGAVSEKRGDPAALDPTLPALPAGYQLYTPAGESTANRLGWAGLLRRWFDMARRPETDTKANVVFRPGDPSNLELSRGLAFLLDARDPVPGP